MIHPIIFKEKSSTLTIKDDDLKQLKKKPKQILWVKDGIYGLIPIEVVRNALEFCENYDILLIEKYKSKELMFQWNETVEIPQSTGRSMEVYNGEDHQPCKTCEGLGRIVVPRKNIPGVDWESCPDCTIPKGEI